MMADRLPRICEAMLYTRSEGAFSLNTIGGYSFAGLYMEKHVTLKFQELQTY